MSRMPKHLGSSGPSHRPKGGREGPREGTVKFRTSFSNTVSAGWGGEGVWGIKGWGLGCGGSGFIYVGGGEQKILNIERLEGDGIVCW